MSDEPRESDMLDAIGCLAELARFGEVVHMTFWTEDGMSQLQLEVEKSGKTETWNYDWHTETVSLAVRRRGFSNALFGLYNRMSRDGHR